MMRQFQQELQPSFDENFSFLTQNTDQKLSEHNTAQFSCAVNNNNNYSLVEWFTDRWT